jgi:hypothetical protein
VQLRATLLRSGVAAEEAALFARIIENGGNYLALEKAATRIGNPLSGTLTAEATSAARYQRLVGQYLGEMERAMGVGRVRVPMGWTAEELYAGFVSRAPVVVGQSFKELIARMGFAYFMFLYASDVPLSSTPLLVVTQETTRELGLPDNPGFRQFVNAMVFGPQPELKR